MTVTVFNLSMQMKTEIEEIVLAMYIYTPIYVLYIIYNP